VVSGFRRNDKRLRGRRNTTHAGFAEYVAPTVSRSQNIRGALNRPLCCHIELSCWHKPNDEQEKTALVQNLYKSKFAREMVINTPADLITRFDKRIGIVRKSIQKKYNNITNTD
jgi:hypothetical protein